MINIRVNTQEKTIKSFVISSTFSPFKEDRQRRPFTGPVRWSFLQDVSLSAFRGAQPSRYTIGNTYSGF